MFSLFTLIHFLDLPSHTFLFLSSSHLKFQPPNNLPLQFPWWSTTNYTLSDRNKLYTATHDLLAALVRHLKHAEHGSGSGIAGLTESLLTDLLYAGLNAPGFSERQRSELLLVSEWAAVGVRVSPLAKWWPFEALGRRKGVDEDVVEVSTDPVNFDVFLSDHFILLYCDEDRMSLGFVVVHSGFGFKACDCPVPALSRRFMLFPILIHCISSLLRGSFIRVKTITCSLLLSSGS